MKAVTAVVQRAALGVSAGGGSRGAALQSGRALSAPPPPKAALVEEPFLNGSSSVYIESMYESWQRDPASVHASWDAFFRSAHHGAGPGSAYQTPPSLAPPPPHHAPLSSLGAVTAPAAAVPASDKAIDDHLAVQGLIRAYQS